MRNKNRKSFFIAVWMLAVFILWTAAVCFVDVQAIGPLNSAVGFAAINQYVHQLTGVNMSLYIITDWLGLVPLVFAAGFASLGLIQWIRRKHLLKVDRSILALGGFYGIVMAVYLFFETVIINYRPVLIDGVLEASYPSSTTMLVMCIIPTALMQFQSRIKSRILKHFVACAMIGFLFFMIIGRLISGVHWFTDIVGGALLSCGLVMLYHSVSQPDIT